MDLERLVALHTALDVAAVRRHIVSMGEDDERVARWDQLVAEHRAPR